MADRDHYLVFVQGIITRLSVQSFQIKGWAVTVVSGLVALAGAVEDARLCLVAVASGVFFWFLDAYYSALEKRFRQLFDRVFENATAPASQMTFDHTTQSGGASIFGYVFRPAVAFFHAPLTAAAASAYFVLKLTDCGP